MGHGVRQLHAENPGGPVKGFQGDDVPLLSQFEDPFRSHRLQGHRPQRTRIAALRQQRPGGPDQARGGYVGFEAAPLPATALPTFRVHHDVPQFPGETAGPIEQPPLHHDSAAESRTQRDDQEVLHPAGIPEQQLADGRGIGIVGEGDGQRIVLLHQADEIDSWSPVQIDGLFDGAPQMIGIGRPNADPAQRGPGGQVGPDRLDPAMQAAHEGFRGVARLGGQGSRTEQVPCTIHEAEGGRGPTDVDAQRQGPLWHFSPRS